ncbi:hypothetical protein BI330_07125 [Mycobacterium sp. CBMA 623]|nr:hypothetical protein [Mycobacteroides sp. CBMA 326]
METYPSFDLNDWKTVAANSGFIAEISITKNRGSGEPAPYKSTVFDASVSKNIKGQLPPSVSFAQLGTAECEAQGRPLLREGRRYLAALNSNTDVPVMSLVSSVELSTADADALERGAPVSPSIETILRSISG